VLSKETGVIFASGWHVGVCKPLPPQRAFNLHSSDVCVQDFIQTKCLTLSLLSLLHLPGETPSCSTPFCHTASAPHAELRLSQWVCSVKLGSASQKQLFVLYPCAFIKKCVSACTHTLHSLKFFFKFSYSCQARAHNTKFSLWCQNVFFFIYQMKFA